MTLSLKGNRLGVVSLGVVICLRSMVVAHLRGKGSWAIQKRKQDPRCCDCLTPKEGIFIKNTKILIAVITACVILVAVTAVLVIKINQKDHPVLVNGEKVPGGVLNYYVNNSLGALEYKFRAEQGERFERAKFLNSKVEGITVREKAKREGLQKTKELVLQILVARRKGIVLSGDEIAAINKRLEDSYKSNPAVAQKFFDEKQITMNDLKYINYADAIITKLRDLMTSDLTVSEKEVKKYYEENRSKFVTPEMVRISHIWLRTADDSRKELPAERMAEVKKKLGIIMSRIKAGEDFAGLAKEFSEDQNSAKKGGDLGYCKRGMMPPDVELIVFGLKPGQVSEPARTGYGYDIIKLLEKQGPKQQSYQDLKEELKLRFLEGKRYERYQALLEEWKKEIK